MPCLVCILVLLSLLFSPAIHPVLDPVDEKELQQILREAVESRRTVGIVAGVIDGEGSRIYCQGKTSKEGAAVDGDTVFEVGSITKTLTATLLADMVLRGEVQLDDPVSKYLPQSVRMPRRGGKEITLLDLVTHTSGLPRMPSNFRPKDAENPYADYTEANLYEFLSSFTLTRDIGEKYEYSNLGFGLLGNALARRAGKGFEELITERIFHPLGMNSTAITLTPEMKSHLATGHSRMLAPVKNWELAALAGAGAVRSTANDMLLYLAANLELRKSDLSAALARAQQAERHTSMKDTEIGLAWHIARKYGSEITWHNGGTGGYHSFVGFDRKKGLGIVILSNSPHSIDDIGMHLLNHQFELSKFGGPVEHKEIRLDPSVLDLYVGEYQLTQSLHFAVSMENNMLYLQATGQPRLMLHPEAETEFFIAEVEAEVTFVKDAAGRVTHLVLHQGGQNPVAQKIR